MLGDLNIPVQFVMRLGDAVYVMLCAGLCAGRSDRAGAESQERSLLQGSQAVVSLCETCWIMDQGKPFDNDSLLDNIIVEKQKPVLFFARK